MSQPIGLSVPGFEALSTYAKKRLESEAIYRDVPRGGRLLERGDPISGAYVVAFGRVRVFTIMADGNEATLYALEPGESCVFALNCMFHAMAYPAWAEADSDSRIVLIPGVLYRELFRVEPLVQDLTVRSLSIGVARLMEELEAIHTMRFDQRLLRFLESRAGKQGKIDMTHQQIARHLGTSREMVSRALRKLCGDGLIDIGRAGIMLRRTTNLIIS